MSKLYHEGLCQLTCMTFIENIQDRKKLVARIRGGTGVEYEG